MNSKAQAGLEYLMTYGWALIMIATVIGVLVFLVGTPTATGFDCKSSDPTKIDFAGSQFDEMQVSGNVKSWFNGKIVLRNLTAGNIQITKLEKDAYFFLPPTIEEVSCTTITPSASVKITSGENFTLGNIMVYYNPASSSDSGCTKTVVPFDRDFGNIYLTYFDQTGLSHDLTLSCQNFPLN